MTTPQKKNPSPREHSTAQQATTRNCPEAAENKAMNMIGDEGTKEAYEYRYYRASLRAIGPTNFHMPSLLDSPILHLTQKTIATRPEERAGPNSNTHQKDINTINMARPTTAGTSHPL